MLITLIRFKHHEIWTLIIQKWSMQFNLRRKIMKTVSIQSTRFSGNYHRPRPECVQNLFCFLVQLHISWQKLVVSVTFITVNLRTHRHNQISTVPQLPDNPDPTFVTTIWFTQEFTSIVRCLATAVVFLCKFSND